MRPCSKAPVPATLAFAPSFVPELIAAALVELEVAALDAVPDAPGDAAAAAVSDEAADSCCEVVAVDVPWLADVFVLAPEPEPAR